MKGHQERSESRPAWTRQQWRIYLADALAKNREISSLPQSPNPVPQVNQITLSELLSIVNPFGTWQWTNNDGAPPLGNLRSMLSHHRVLAYRANRDHLRALRGAPPIWSSSHQLVGASTWLHRDQPLRKRFQALRTLWDLRWHGGNRAIATNSRNRTHR